MGIQALFSLPESTYGPVIGMVSVLVVAFLMTRLSMRLQASYAQQTALKKNN